MQITEIITRTRWNVEMVHSVIGFKVKHLVVSNMRGEFKDYKAGIYTKSENFLNAEVDVSINPASISTGDVSRDAHLKGPDFFDVENFREIHFRGTGLEKVKGEIYSLPGDLTIKGITKAIRLDVEFEGVTKSPRGDKRAYFLVTGKINRKDWGLTWSAVMESGGVMVGEEIFLYCEIELFKHPDNISANF